MTALKPPKTVREFEESLDPTLWNKRRVPADETDKKEFKTTWTLKSDPAGHAHVEYAHGRLIVDLPKVSYWFDLSRLNEGWPYWSWQQQLEGKAWCLPEHLELIDELSDMFPPE